MHSRPRIEIRAALLAWLTLPASLFAQTAPATPAAASTAAPQKLDAIEVIGERPKPFSTPSVDLPRTIDDPQAYFVFDAKAIDLSGATTIEDFLTNNLTMNVLRSTNSSNTTSYGSNSDVNLRGLGVDRTLILVNGRRLPNTVVLTSNYQSDINGIAPSMIERIEVLPSSASGIYGANAVGGVINIILKRNYSGGEIRANYSNTWDSDAARRSIAFNYGMGLEGGKTRLSFSANYSDGNALRLMDRADLIRANYDRARRNNPDHVYTAAGAFAGATTNVTNSVAANLVLKTGATLSSRYTYVPAGTAPTVTSAQLNAALTQNAGSFNFDLPSIYWLQSGLGSYFGFTPTSRSVSASLTRKMTDKIEASVDYSFNRNRGESLYSSYFNSTRTVAANAPTNPFTTAVLVRMPAENLQPRVGTFDSNTLNLGLKATLAHDWIALIDYTWAKNKNGHYFTAVDNGVVNLDLQNGVINPFVDTQLHRVSLERYATKSLIAHGATQSNLAARGSGPLPKLPWGTPTLTFGVENRITGTIDGTSETIAPLTPASNTRTHYLGLQQVIGGAYAEVQMPLVKRGHFPLVHSLDLQVAGRYDRYQLATGTPTATVNTITGATTIGAPNRAGQPFRSEATFSATNPTIALRYQPVPEFTLRGSYATAFQPPTAAQMVRNPEPAVTPTLIIDPRSNTSYNVQTIGGGNPNVQPQSSNSWTGGIIWSPRASALKGLRLNAEYYRIEQFDAISTLTAQVIANLYPDRVTRDAAGLITLVDISSINLYGRKMSGWDFKADYQLNTPQAGTFTFSGVQSLVISSTTRFSLTLPAYEGVNFPLDTSIGGTMKHRTTLNFSWERGNWNARWTSRLLSSYKAYGAAGGPLSLQSAAGANFSTYALAQGNNATIPAQNFHDLVVGYKFASGSKRFADRITEGMSITVGMKNLFNSAPEYDVGPFGLGYLSPFGDIRMREYWINVRRTF